MRHSRLGLLLPAIVLAAGLGGCDLMAPKQAGEAGAPPLTAEQEAARAALPAPVRKITPQTPAVRAYRKTGARHIYAAYKARIYKGRMPPLVYAVATVETHLDANGEVEAVTFMRAPEQAPEVSLEIVELIKKSSPLPSPGKIGAHTYVETWLWDKSGKFQLDSLTEGQRSR
jgi:periplasmic protein TonB